MSQVTHLASGALNRSGDTLTVELIQPDSIACRGPHRLACRGNDHHTRPLQRHSQYSHAAARRRIHGTGSDQSDQAQMTASPWHLLGHPVQLAHLAVFSPLGVVMSAT
jgi:hypothetical protein